jgi:hypothetical protein
MIDESAVLFKADSFSSIGQHDRAAEILASALAEEPSNVRLLVAMSRSHSRSRRYAQSEEAAAAALEADPSSVEAKLALAWAVFQLDREPQMVTLAEEVLAVEPEHSQAHLYVALGLAYGRKHRVPRRTADRARAEYRAALALTRTPTYYLWAAEIERRLRNSAAAKEHVAAGLELDPVNVDLLKLRAELAPTNQEKISILSGILAANPFDRSSRETLSDVYRRKRLSKYTLQWGLIFWLTLIAGTTDGLGTFFVSLVVWVIVIAAWGLKNNATARDLSEFAALRKSSFRFGVLTANLSFWWFIATLLGSILLAHDVDGGLFVLLAAMVFWMSAHSIIVVNDARDAIQDSPPTAGPHEHDVPAELRTLARRRSVIGVAAPLGLIVLSAIIAIFSSHGVITAQIAAGLVVLCATAGLLYLVQGLVFSWTTKPTPGMLLRSFVRLVVLGGFLVFLLVVGMKEYSAGFDASAPAPAPAAPDPGRLDPQELERRLNPTPVPTFRIPTMPTMPPIPPLE